MAKSKTVNVMFYDKRFNRKPIGQEIGLIQKRLAKTTIVLEKLANNMADGCTFKCAYMDGTKNTDFVSQQLYGLDFDHNITIEEGLHKCETLGIMPVFGYTTFSHLPESHRFRLIFCNNKVVYDVGERRKIQLSLMKAFGFADPACKDETRMFFGGRSLAAKYGLKKITNFYSFSEYGVDVFTESEENAKILKENNVTLKGLSRELVLRTFGEETANKIYPQFKFENSRGTSKKSDEHTTEIVSCIQYCLDKKKYCTETDIVRMLNSRYNHVTTEIQIKKSLQEILTSYGLKRVRANKDYKERYNIEGNGYPFIIIRDSE